jgi:hypothetical protein
LPAPEVHGATAVYRSVLPGVNLHVTATEQGYTHALEVLSAQAAAQAGVRQQRYVIGGDLQARSNGDGTIRLVDSAGRTVAWSAPASMWDSSTDPANAGEVPENVPTRSVAEPATPVEPAVTSLTGLAQVSVADGVVTVAPDAGFLDSPEVTFPVFVDPAIGPQRTKWAYATSNGENNDTTSARVGRQPSPDGSGERYRSFFDFSVSALRGKEILSATVFFKLDHSWSCSPKPVHLYRTAGGITVANGRRMAWGTRPLPQTWLGWADANANESSCGQPDADVEFAGASLTADLQYAADKTVSHLNVR